VVSYPVTTSDECNNVERAALVVATGRYDDIRLRHLRSPRSDARSLAQVLSDPAIGGFCVRTLIDRRSYELAEEIENFFSDRRRDDIVLMYVTGHGIKDEAGRLYFAATNTKLDRLAATGLSSRFVSEQMERTRSRRVVMVLDCCYSGAFARLVAKADDRVDAVERLQGAGRVVITASSAMEYAFEGDRLAMDEGSPSVFTDVFVTGLQTGDADLDGDGQITVDELYEYVFEKVRLVTPNQTPGKIQHLRGTIVIAQAARSSVESAKDRDYLVAGDREQLLKAREVSAASHGAGTERTDHDVTSKYRVLIVDDHPVVRRGLRTLLIDKDWVEEVFEASTVASALREAVTRRADVIAMDIALPDGDGLDATQRILTLCPDASVLILTLTDDETFVSRALQSGARGYVLKDTDPDMIGDALRTVAGGGVVLGPKIGGGMLAALHETATGDNHRRDP
jgi:DNA-binding NarL/FixJ family response regulator